VRSRSFLLLLCFTLCLIPGQVFAAADTVAVLPFFNNAQKPNLDWVGESVAETLREALAGAGVLALSREDRVEVYTRLSVRSGVPLTHATVLRIGESLDAAQVVFGGFELAPPPAGSSTSRGQLKLTASVLDRKRLHEGPVFTESGPLEDLSLLESRLAWQCLQYFQPRSVSSEASYLQDRPPVRIDAVEGYVRGLLSLSPEQQVKLFVQAAKLDPRYSEPNFQLGRMAFGKKEYRVAQAWLEKVAATDSHYHESRFLLGLCQYYQGEFDAAAQSLQQVAAQVPLNEVFNDLGAAQCRKNKPEAVENFRKALEGDESDPDYWFNVGYALWKAGKTSEAAPNFQSVLDRSPDDGEAQTLLARCQRGEGPQAGEYLSGERIKKTFEETAFLQLQAELKK
jgi:tetratricopeptide (TPR) repeat protein